jgi:hypothetical protein
MEYRSSVRVVDVFHDEENASFPPSVPCVKRVNEIGLILLLDVYTVTEYICGRLYVLVCVSARNIWMGGLVCIYILYEFA